MFPKLGITFVVVQNCGVFTPVVNTTKKFQTLGPRIRLLMAAKILNTLTGEQTCKRLLRQRGSDEYFKDGGWTNNPDEADSFCDVVEAAETCARHGLTDVELAVRLDAHASDVFCTPLR